MGLELLGLTAVLLLAGAPTGRADRCNGLVDGTFINDYSECDAFFTCVRDVSVPGRCPEPFTFNEYEQLCDFPWNTVCLLCPQPVDGVEMPGFTFEVIEGECRKYAVCTNGIGSLRECSAGLMYDPVQETCALEDTVDCVESVCPNNLNPNMPTMIDDTSDCANYFICFNGEHQSATCGGDLFFNPTIGQCDFPENVDCEPEPGPVVIECPQDQLIYYVPNPENCVTYFICLNGEKQDNVMECAPGLIFDVNTSRCALYGPGTKCVEGTYPTS